MLKISVRKKRGYFVVTPVLLIAMIGQYNRYYCISRYGYVNGWHRSCLLSIYIYVYTTFCFSYGTNFEYFFLTFRVVQTKGWMLTGILDDGYDAKYLYSLKVVRSLLLSDQWLDFCAHRIYIEVRLLIDAVSSCFLISFFNATCVLAVIRNKWRQLSQLIIHMHYKFSDC